MYAGGSCGRAGGGEGRGEETTHVLQAFAVRPINQAIPGEGRLGGWTRGWKYRAVCFYSVYRYEKVREFDVVWSAPTTMSSNLVLVFRRRWRTLLVGVDTTVDASASLTVTTGEGCWCFLSLSYLAVVVFFCS